MLHRKVSQFFNLIQEFSQVFSILSVFIQIDITNFTVVRKLLLYPKIKCTFRIMSSSLNVTRQFDINSAFMLFVCLSEGLETSVDE